MLAAAAVGVSHLVQSTKAGADFGLSLSWLIIVIAIIKYPAFRFGVDYSNHTGNSLVAGYKKQGRLAQAWLGLAFFVDMFVATAALSLVTAGMLIATFDLPFTASQVSVAVLVASALLLLNGSYAKSEGIIKVLVLIFTIFTVLSTLIVLPVLGSEGRDLFGSITLDQSMMLFVIAMAGWMPMPMTGSIFLSMWAKEKQSLQNNEGQGANSKSVAIMDLKFGWILTVVLALCFLILGAAVLFQTGHETPASAPAMAATLFKIFTSVIGDWAFPVIAATAITVMWSSVFSVIDVIPRLCCSLFDTKKYNLFLVIQLVGSAIVVTFFMGSFKTFIAFATSAGFITAPVIAYYNYKSVISDEVSKSYVPSKKLVVWHWVSFYILLAFTLAYFYMSYLN
jgi:Mn2+/Fe2+ NRAMP family transporter